MSRSDSPLLPDDWPRLGPLLDRLLEAGPGERPALLEELAGGDLVLQLALERMLIACEQNLPLLEEPAIERFSQLWEENSGPSLPEVVGGRYRIERELGRGGMAKVYLAEDLKHGRQVAVKVIRHELAATLGRDRFLREIAIAARLRHPNIMPLYDSGDVDGLLYFVMPYEAGSSLRVRLDNEPALSLSEKLSILRDLCRALAYAHQQGVVHRDIKPDNILLSGGAAVVTDFGIAKAVSEARTVSDTALTQSGVVIGTPAYMSPEQAMGDPGTDYRTDLYAFGCVAYEVLSGKPPFAGGSAFQIISAQMSEAPKSLVEVRGQVPATVAALVERCLRKNPGERPASAAEAAAILDEITVNADESRPPGRSVRIIAAVAVLTLALLGAWKMFVRPSSAAALAPITLAVLPLSVEGDSAQPIAQGFRDELTIRLTAFPWIKVLSRSGALRYKNQADIETESVCADLKVGFLVTGALRRVESAYSLTLQLIHCDQDQFVWGERLVSASDFAGLTNQVVDSLRVKLRPFAPAGAELVAMPRTSCASRDREATLYCLVAKTRLDERGTSVRESLKLFRLALDRDSTLAEAWAGIAQGLAVATAFDGMRADSVIPISTSSARRALALDSTLSRAHVALGLAAMVTWDWEEAQRQLQESLRLDPDDSEARAHYGRLLILLGRVEDGRRQLQVGLEHDQRSPQLLAQYSFVLAQLGQRDSSLRVSKQMMDLYPDFFVGRMFRAMILLYAGRGPEARELVRDRLPFEEYTLYILAATGDTSTVRERLRTIEASGYKPGKLWGARAYGLLGLGDTAQALTAIETATRLHEVWPIFGPVSLPVFDRIRESDRFRAVLKTVGLAAP